MSRCIGCGIKIQTTDPNKPGYVPEIIALEQGEEVYCKRCHNIRHHHIAYEYSTSTKEYYQKIQFIKNTKSLIILIVDALNLESSFIPNLKESIGNNKVLILINKTDILPSSLKMTKLEMFVKEKAKGEKLNIVSVMMISAFKKKNIDKVMEKIKKLRYKKTYDKKNPKLLFDDCYVMGCASVGKSTLH